MRAAINGFLKLAMRPMLAAAIVTVILALGMAPTAHATSVFVLGGNPGNVTLTGDSGTGDLTVTIPASFTGTAFANMPGLDSGTFTFSPVTLTTGPENTSGIYAINTTAGTFSYTGADGDTFSGNVTWSFIKDGTTTPELAGTITITAITGDTAFTNAVPAVGSTIAFDMTLNVTNTLETIVASNLTETGTLSDGELSPVPEPGSLALIMIGIGLIGFAVHGRSRFADSLES